MALGGAVWPEIGGSISPKYTANGNVLEFAPQVGAPAQGNSNPQSTFSDHAIVKYNNKIYDPSYGTQIFSSEEEWESASLHGAGIAFEIVYFPPSGGMIYLMWLYDKNIPLPTIIIP
jgi:hypothetical protein